MSTGCCRSNPWSEIFDPFSPQLPRSLDVIFGILSGQGREGKHALCKLRPHFAFIGQELESEKRDRFSPLSLNQVTGKLHGGMRTCQRFRNPDRVRGILKVCFYQQSDMYLGECWNITLVGRHATTGRGRRQGHRKRNWRDQGIVSSTDKLKYNDCWSCCCYLH